MKFEVEHVRCKKLYVFVTVDGYLLTVCCYFIEPTLQLLMNRVSTRSSLMTITTATSRHLSKFMLVIQNKMN